MTWFERHLNWSAFLTWLLALFIIAAVDFTLLATDSWLSHEELTAVSVIVCLIVLPLAWGWVLRQKKRSLGWLLPALFVPLGFLCIFVLENRSPVSDTDSQSYVATRSGPRLEETGHVAGERQVFSMDAAQALCGGLPTEYCAKCGRPLSVRSAERAGTDSQTGRPRYIAILACPETALYESGLGLSRLSWRFGRGGHTVTKRSFLFAGRQPQ